MVGWASGEALGPGEAGQGRRLGLEAGPGAAARDRKGVQRGWPAPPFPGERRGCGQSSGRVTADFVDENGQGCGCPQSTQPHWRQPAPEPPPQDASLEQPQINNRS